jgi:hypothetical protein
MRDGCGLAIVAVVSAILVVLTIVVLSVVIARGLL